MFMTRNDALRNLLSAIFGGITIGISDGKIDRKVSFYQKYNYNHTALNEFNKLFWIAFVQENPLEIKTNKDIDKDVVIFDRESALKNAIKYLERRGVNTSYLKNAEQKEKERAIYEIFSGYILPAIMSNNDNIKRKEAENVDITESMISAFSQTFAVTSKMVLFNPYAICEKTSEETDSSFDNNKSSYTTIVDFSSDSRLNILNRLFSLNVSYLMSEELESSCLYRVETLATERESLLNHLVKNEFKNTKICWHQIAYFDNTDDLFELKKWTFKANLDNSLLFNSNKCTGLNSIINSYDCNLKKKALEQIEPKLEEKLKPHYETACDYFEKLLDLIIASDISKIDFNNFANLSGKGIEELLKEKAEKLIIDFEVVYYYIKKYHKEDSGIALYVMLQNLVVDVTEMIKETGAGFAAGFKNALSPDRYKKHMTVINKRKGSQKLDRLIKLETNLYKDNKEDYKNPESFYDYFHYKRKFVFNGLKNALNEYYNELKKLQK